MLKFPRLFPGSALPRLLGSLVLVPLFLGSSPVGHAQTAAPRITGTDGSTTGTASFLGNFNDITDGRPTEFVLQRQADCSLNIITATEATSGSTVDFTIASNIPHYERTLHQIASLTTTPDVFAKGCPEKSTGISSRVGVYLGQASPGIGVVSLIVPDNTYVTAIRTRLYNLNTLGVTESTSEAISNPGGLATADLNGDGIGDLAVVNYGPFVYVMLGKSDGTFKSPVPYQIGGQSSVAAVIDDVTGDGKLDLITVSADQVITIFPGAGDGTFLAPLLPIHAVLSGTNSSATPIQALITADLRGVGRKDILCSNGIVLLNNGDGSFTQVSAAAFPFMQGAFTGQPLGMATGDFNGDGNVDLVTTTGQVISTWFGKGDGTFATGTSYTSIDNTGYVTVSDLDGDGNLDIYTGQANGGLYSGDVADPGYAYALMGNGDGTFAGAPILSAGSYTGNNLADVNGDGNPDLITNNSGQYDQPTATFTVRLGNGKGGFTAGSTITAPANFTGTTSGLTSSVPISGADTAIATSFAVGDVNGDGKADLVFVDNGLTATNPSSGMGIIYPAPIYFVALSNGDGTFKTPVPYSFPQISPSSGFDTQLNAKNVQIADFNHDGKGDLIFSYVDQIGTNFGQPTINPYQQGFVVLTGKGDGTFSTTPILSDTFSSAAAPTTASLPLILGTPDFNRDGNPDLLVNNQTFSVATGAVNQLQTLIGNGDGSFKAPVTYPLAPNVYGVPVVVDFNKDGKLDLVTLAETQASQAELAIALGNGDGTFATATTFNLDGGDSIRSAGLAAADFNADGNVDIALLGEYVNGGVFYGKGDGTFTYVPTPSYVVPKDLITIAAGGPAAATDLNKDGKPDILAGNVILLNVYGTAPVLTTSTTTTLTASATSITTGTSVTFTATITPAAGSTATPTGTVTFMDGTATLCSAVAVSSSKATCATTALTVGAQSVTAVYSGDSNFTGSTSSAVVVTVTAPVIATTTTLAASNTSAVSGTSITFTVTVTPASGTTSPTGTVSFLDGTTTIGSGTLSAGVATFNTSTLAVGSNSITAAYQGASGTNLIFSPSTSSPLAVTITAPPVPSFTIALSSATSTISAPGGSATTTLTVTPTNGFNAATSLTCTASLIAGENCSIAPNSVTPNGTAASTAIVTLQTSAVTGSLNHQRESFPLAATLPLGLFISGSLLTLGRRRLRRRAAQLFAFAFFAALLAATGCGKSSSENSTPTPQTVTLTITATSGTITQSTPWTVTIQ